MRGEMEGSDPVEPRRKGGGTKRWRLRRRGDGGGVKVTLLVLSSAPLLQSPRQRACRAPVRCIITGKTTDREGRSEKKQ